MQRMQSRSLATTPLQRTFDELGTPLHDVTFCVIDLETTGTNRELDMITEIGAVKVRGGQCVGTFQTLVNPGRAISPQITMLTGLCDTVVASAPRIEAVLGSLIEFVGDSVIVGHNVGFDVGFLRAACLRADRPALDGQVIDTVALARRLVRNEVPDCKLATLAARFHLDHRPSHRALDDALATADLLHLLIERAAGMGVLGLDDLVMLSKLAGHPQASKLKMTTDLPRSPGVYMFRGQRDELLYVGKASNLRQRVRSYFGSDDRRKVGPMLRETQSVTHLELPDALTAEIIEGRLIGRMLPRYNTSGTHAAKYCYVKLDIDAAWPRLSVVKNPSPKGLHLGPLPSRTMARLVVEAIHTAVPLRRCTARMGRGYTAPSGAAECSAAQLGVALCPCSGTADPAAYATAVDAAARALSGDPRMVVEQLRDRMTRLAVAQRYEEAAATRDRLDALLGAVRRHLLVDAMRSAERAELRLGESTWIIDAGRLLDATLDGTTARSLPIPPPEPCTGDVLSRTQIDEVLCLARFCERRAPQLAVRCSGTWKFPIGERVPSMLARATQSV